MLARPFGKGKWGVELEELSKTVRTLGSLFLGVVALLGALLARLRGVVLLGSRCGLLRAVFGSLGGIVEGI